MLRAKLLLTAVCGALAVHAAPATAQNRQGIAPVLPEITALVGRLDLERYQATIKGLTQFGDRREGTQRNRDAVDWIEAS